MADPSYQPEGYTSVAPYLVMRGCLQAIEFNKTVFDARELFRTASADKRVIDHAELAIGDAMIMVADAHTDSSARSLAELGGTAVSLVVYVPDADATFGRAIANGARVDDPVKDKPYGDRSGTFIDPFGHRWTVATHVRDLAAAELASI
jgi:PhnB protein